MSRVKFAYKQKVVKISEPQQKDLDRIMATGRYIAEAEVFREGLSLVLRRIAPPYLAPSVDQQIKKEKVQKEVAFQAVPDEEFVSTTLKDVLIYVDAEEKKWLFYRKAGNNIGALPLDQVKVWVKDNGPEYLYHKQVAGDDHQPYQYFLESPDYMAVGTRQDFREMGIAIPPEIV